MPWREARASKGRFIFVILAIAAGVGALSGVKGFNESVRYTLLAEARTLMGADLVVRLQVDPTDEEIAFLESLEARGIDYTPVTETVSMTASDQVPQPLLSSIKSADLSERIQPPAGKHKGQVRFKRAGQHHDRAPEALSRVLRVLGGHNLWHVDQVCKSRPRPITIRGCGLGRPCRGAGLRG